MAFRPECIFSEYMPDIISESENVHCQNDLNRINKTNKIICRNYQIAVLTLITKLLIKQQVYCTKTVRTMVRTVKYFYKYIINNTFKLV